MLPLINISIPPISMKLALNRSPRSYKRKNTLIYHKIIIFNKGLNFYKGVLLKKISLYLTSYRMDFNIHSRKANQNDLFIRYKINYSYLFEFIRKHRFEKLSKAHFAIQKII